MSRRVRDRLPGEYRWWMALLPESVSLFIICMKAIHRATPENLLEVLKVINTWKEML